MHTHTYLRSYVQTIADNEMHDILPVLPRTPITLPSVFQYVHIKNLSQIQIYNYIINYI